MIVERVTFRLKFGKAKEGIAIWKEMIAVIKKKGKNNQSFRLLSDLTGPSYTLIIEMQLRSLMDIGSKNYEWMSSKELGELYQQFIPLCEAASREYFNIEAEI